MRKFKKFLLIALTTLFLIVFGNASAFAHYPPSCGDTDCGLIEGSTFYSDYYSPGNPNGTPVSAGGGTWTRTSNTPCDNNYWYEGTRYVLYPYKFICSTPLDTNSYFLIAGVALMGFLTLRKQIVLSNNIL